MLADIHRAHTWLCVHKPVLHKPYCFLNETFPEAITVVSVFVFQELSPYRAVNTLRFDYKNQSVNYRVPHEMSYH